MALDPRGGRTIERKEEDNFAEGKGAWEAFGEAYLASRRVYP